MEDRYSIVLGSAIAAKAILAAKVGGAGLAVGSTARLAGPNLRPVIQEARRRLHYKRAIKGLKDPHIDTETRNKLILLRELSKPKDKSYSDVVGGAFIGTMGLGYALTDAILERKKVQLRKREKELDEAERRLNIVRQTQKTNPSKVHPEMKVALVNRITALKNEIIRLKINS
jgi:hypothetical protein